METPQQPFEAQNNESTVDIRIWIGRILSIWPFLLGGLAVGLLGAFLLLRYTNNTYETKGVLFIESSSKSQL